ncbi:MAG: hypothetical protein ACPG8W_01625 [Candidatus Promineifilaceae bacterium]
MMLPTIKHLNRMTVKVSLDENGQIVNRYYSARFGAICYSVSKETAKRLHDEALESGAVVELVPCGKHGAYRTYTHAVVLKKLSITKAPPQPARTASTTSNALIASLFQRHSMSGRRLNGTYRFGRNKSARYERAGV